MSTVLVVDDSPDVRRVLRAMLARCGHDVVEAGAGPEAIALASRHAGPIDLVVTDIVMPRMSGEDCIVELRRHRPGLKVLYISGYPKEMAVRRNGAPFLEKPFTPATLRAKVDETLAEPLPLVS